MKTAHLLANYEDGNDVGWPEEFKWLWTNQPDYMSELVQDIAVRGIRTPVLLGPDGSIWDGHHRIAAAVALGLEEIPAEEAE